MTWLRSLDDGLLADVNGFARHTPWLHGAVLDYAIYGLALFAVLLLVGVLRSRTRADRALAASGWACCPHVVPPLATGGRGGAMTAGERAG